MRLRVSTAVALLTLVLIPRMSLAVGGEDCATATVISALPFSDSGDTCSAVDDYNESCAFLPEGGRDVVYRYTPSTDQAITINLCPSDYDTKVYVYAGACPLIPNSGGAVACNDDACGVNGWRSLIVSVPLAGGIEYFIVIDGYGAPDCGSYSLSIDETTPFLSETCDTAETITLPWSGTVSTVGATDDYNESCPFPIIGAPDVVRRFVAPETGSLSLDLCGSDFDTKVYVYEGVCPLAGSQVGVGGSGTALTCNDDACGVSGFRSRVFLFSVTAGEEYFVVFDGYGATDFGSASGSIEYAPPPEVGESCELAIPISTLPFTTTGTTAGASRFEHACQFIFTGAPEHFFSFTAASDTWLEIDSCGSEFDTEITVLGGGCPIPIEPNASTVLACNDDGCGVDATRARVSAVFVEAGEAITIVVDGLRSGDFGDYTLTVRETCAPDHPSELTAQVEVGERPIGLALHEGTGRLFVTNFGVDTVTVIDTVTDTILATIPVGDGPYRLGFTPDGSRLYIVNYFGNTIDSLDPITLAPIASFSALGVHPLGLCFSPDGSALFVATEGDGRVTKWSIPGHQSLGEVGGLGAPREMITAPDGLVYVTDTTGVNVWEISADPLVATAIAVDEFPQALALTEDGDYLLVGNFGFDRSLDHASVIDRHSRAIVANLRIGTGPEEMVLVPGTPYLAVTNWGFSQHPNTNVGELGANLGNVAMVRLPEFSEVGDPVFPPMIDAIEMIISVGGDYTFGIAVTPDGQKIYSANSGYSVPGVASTVSVIEFPGGWVSGRFVRGDANGDGALNIADPIVILSFLFGGVEFACANAGDVNDDEALDIADPIALLGVLFNGVAPPSPTCRADRTAGGLCCEVGCGP